MIPYRLNPLGIRVNEVIPLTLTAEQANSTVKLTANGSPTVSGLHYRLGKSGAWLAYTIGTTITLTNVGDSVQFWNSADTLTTNSSNYVRFATSGKISCSGNIQSLLNFSDTCPQYCFWLLFLSNTALTSAPDMPAINVNDRSYSGTYSGCTGLIYAPKILPARTLYIETCYAMFVNCGFSTAPIIKAETLGTDSLSAIFSNCRSLSRIEVSFSSWNKLTSNWVANVAVSGTFIKPSALPEEYGEKRIPTGWTVVNK